MAKAMPAGLKTVAEAWAAFADAALYEMTVDQRAVARVIFYAGFGSHFSQMMNAGEMTVSEIKWAARVWDRELERFLSQWKPPARG